MKRTGKLRIAVASTMLVLSAGAGAQGTSNPGVGRNWAVVVTPTAGGHLVGNPAAKVQVREYISYTCPHCAAFAREGEAPLSLAYIAPGRVSLEIRHLIRDPIDLTAALLANCGPPSKFLQNHRAFLLGQPKWIGPLVDSSPAQQARWRVKGLAGRRAIANDFKFFDLMERRGYSRVATDQCLANEALARKLATDSDADWKLPGVQGTPTFAINGVILSGTASWTTLAPQIDARL